MAFDSYDLVILPEASDYICVDCCEKAGIDHKADDVRPLFNLDEVDDLPVCGRCGHIAEYCSFGGTAVNNGIEMLREYLVTDWGNTTYLDAYAEHLRWCNMDPLDYVVLNIYNERRRHQNDQ